MLYRLIPLSIIVALLLLPALAQATPQFVNRDWEADSDLAAQLYPYGAVGSDFDIPAVVIDKELCLDNSEDSIETNIDVKGNDNSLLGSRFNVLTRGPGQTEFNLLKSVVVDANMMKNSCSPSEPGGAVEINPELSIVAPTERQELKVQFVPASGGAPIETGVAPLYTFFAGQSFRWCPGPTCYKKGGKKLEVTVRGPKQMIGMKVYFLWRAAKSKTFKPARIVELHSRKGKAYAKISHKRGKGNWGAYACLGYSERYPSMWVGNACPQQPIAASELEKLFPGSTRGF